jgi:hypothetical protein
MGFEKVVQFKDILMPLPYWIDDTSRFSSETGEK